MTTDHDDIRDRLAVVDGLRRYAYAIDDRDFNAVRALFTPDAHLDYTASGGPAGPRDEVVAWIEQGLGLVGPTQHVLANEQVEIDGPDATSRCYLFNPLLSADEPPSHVALIGGEYRDRWRRGPDGWHIVDRVHHVTWTRALTT